MLDAINLRPQRGTAWRLIQDRGEDLRCCGAAKGVYQGDAEDGGGRGDPRSIADGGGALMKNPAGPPSSSPGVPLPAQPDSRSLSSFLFPGVTFQRLVFFFFSLSCGKKERKKKLCD